MTRFVHERQFLAPLCVTPSLRASSRNSRTTGLSLLETAVYLSVLSLIGGPIVMMTVDSTRTTTETSRISRLIERNRSSMHRIAADVRRGIADTVTVSDTGKTLTFSLPGGFDGSGATAGEIISYLVEDDPSDAADSADNNGNALVDEKVLVRFNQTTNDRVTIAASLDGATTGFEVSGSGVMVTLSTKASTETGTTQPRMSQTIVIYPRN